MVAGGIFAVEHERPVVFHLLIRQEQIVLVQFENQISPICKSGHQVLIFWQLHRRIIVKKRKLMKVPVKIIEIEAIAISKKDTERFRKR